MHQKSSFVRTRFAKSVVQESDTPVLRGDNMLLVMEEAIREGDPQELLQAWLKENKWGQEVWCGEASSPGQQSTVSTVGRGALCCTRPWWSAAGRQPPDCWRLEQGQYCSSCWSLTLQHYSADLPDAKGRTAVHMVCDAGNMVSRWGTFGRNIIF